MTEARLSLEDLSRRTGEPLDKLRQWRQAGLIGGEGEGFSLEDAERVYMVQLFLRRGIGLEAIAKANDEHGFLHRYLDVVFPRGVGRTCSLAEAAEQSGMNVEVVRRIIEASGLTDEGDTLTEDDVGMLQGASRIVDAGFPLEALLQVLRVYADTLSRAAEAGTRTFHAYVHERLTAAGMPADEPERAIGDQVLPLVEPTIIYFFRRGQAKASREDIVLHVAEAAGLLPPADVPGQMKRAVAFVDLSSFTPMTAEMGDLKAAEVLQQFSQLVRESAARSDGRVVKQIGDAFMLVFPQAASAVACLLEIERRVAVETQFPAVRGGIACGSVLYREGDYVGSLVNLASRLAGEADRHQVLITSDVRKEAAGLPDVEFSPLGRRHLKGITDDIELFEARLADSAPPGAKVIDPVCGIELGAGEVAVSLTLDGVAHSFCSEDCLRKFVGSPERYTQRPPA